MCSSVPIDEAFNALIPSQEELKTIHESYDNASFKGFPSKLGKQHMWLDKLHDFYNHTINSLRQNKGYSFRGDYQDRALYQRLYYLKIIHKALDKSAGDLSSNAYARLYEFNVLQLMKWVIFKDSEKEFENFLRRVDTHC